MRSERANTYALTAFAILAFAANSVLTRRALAGSEMAPGAFVAIRLISGAIVLGLLGAWRRSDIIPKRADCAGIATLTLYAVAFTFAYVRLGAAVGALILFPTVQLTLVMVASLGGNPPSRREALGSVTALAGIVWLLAPNVSTPALAGAGMMGIAGVAWALYTSLGRGAGDPFGRTARNFLGATPIALLMGLASSGRPVTTTGIILAVMSGAVTSGLGYVLWYSVLPKLTASAAGAAQLLVPAVAALAGVGWLGERPSIALLAGSTLILVGVGWVMGFSPRPRPSP